MRRRASVRASASLAIEAPIVYSLLRLKFSLSDRADRVPDVRRFFVGWTQRPSQVVFENLLRGSTLVVLAIDEVTDEVIGFATAVTDGVVAGYIPLAEVVPEFQGHGVGSAMIKRLLKRMDHLYMVDVVCDEDLVDFYARFGMSRGISMSLRRPSALGQDRNAA